MTAVSYWKETLEIYEDDAISKNTRNALLSGLPHQAVINNNTVQIESVTAAIKLFNE